MNKEFLYIHGRLSPKLNTSGDIRAIYQFYEPPGHGLMCDDRRIQSRICFSQCQIPAAKKSFRNLTRKMWFQPVAHAEGWRVCLFYFEESEKIISELRSISGSDKLPYHDGTTIFGEDAGTSEIQNERLPPELFDVEETKVCLA
ncbi:hypothetical protein EDD22DRAFT_949842 [Suillus occidentalis]|nr:hypothetical protein EDD22DRAFT_949842 [Suillus occidentalis]